MDGGGGGDRFGSCRLELRPAVAGAACPHCARAGSPAPRLFFVGTGMPRESIRKMLRRTDRRARSRRGCCAAPAVCRTDAAGRALAAPIESSLACRVIEDPTGRIGAPDGRSILEEMREVSGGGSEDWEDFSLIVGESEKTMTGLIGWFFNL